MDHSLGALASCSDEDLFESLKGLLQDRVPVLQALVDWAVPDIVYGNSRILETRHTGRVKSFSTNTGYGFIHSQEITDALGKDLFLSIEETAGRGHPPGTFTTGSELSFVILLNKGKPQAYDLAPPDFRPGAFLQSRAPLSGKDEAMARAPPAAAQNGCAADGKKGGGKVTDHSQQAWWGKAGGKVAEHSQQDWWGKGGGKADHSQQDWWGKGGGKASDWGGGDDWQQSYWGKGGGCGGAAPAPPPVQQTSGGAVPTYSSVPGLTGVRFWAPVKSFNAEKRYGFLLCEELASTFGKADVFVHASQLGSLADFKVGQTYSFTVVVDSKGKPMAIDLAPGDAAVGGGGAFNKDGRFTAAVKSFNSEKKYGFFNSPELESAFGKADIFVHATQISHLNDFKVGQVFSFSVAVDDKGKPMAVDLVPEGGGGQRTMKRPRV
mmetsp:Transcript_101381/g.285992  ORF Transcript_101381/g.285992 Transcript_101381/m.285992 type:complete len:436 (-) Transcript_101381:56-1363(-)